MFKMTKRFLAISAILLILLCTTVFICMGMFLDEKSKEAISEIGTIYMSEMSQQIHQKFDAIIDLQLSKTEGIVRRTPEENVQYGDEMIRELTLSAQVRDFTYLGLYTKDGQEQIIYGNPIKVVDEEEFYEILNDVLKEETRRMTSGLDINGN